MDYLFIDASHFKMHDGARSEPVLLAYGITTAGNPVFVHLDGVSAESTDACVGFCESMLARGLRTGPVLVISDGAPGLCAALDQVFPHARRQRCLIHRGCKESRRCFRSWASLVWYGDHRGGPVPDRSAVRRAVAAPE